MLTTTTAPETVQELDKINAQDSVLEKSFALDTLESRLENFFPGSQSIKSLYN